MGSVLFGRMTFIFIEKIPAHLYPCVRSLDRNKDRCKPPPSPCFILCQFFAQHAPQQFFKRRLVNLDIIAQPLVYHRVIVTAAQVINPLAEPIEDIAIQANCDALFTGGIGMTAPRTPFEKPYSGAMSLLPIYFHLYCQNI